MNLQLFRALHVKSVASGQHAVAAAVREHFRQQLQAVARELELLQALSVDVVFPRERWQHALPDALHKPLGKLMWEGAAAELLLFKKRKSTTATEAVEQYGLELEPWILTERPNELSMLIELELRASLTAPWWDSVLDTTRRQVADTLSVGLENGWSIRRTAKAVEGLSATYGRMEATRISRTETSRALNAGHLVGMQQLQTDAPELKLSKQWVSVMGSTTRESHARMDGTTVPVDAMFDLDGHQCRFPSDSSLPPEHAIHCQCSLISSWE